MQPADVTIFGATGFTGTHVVSEALRSLPEKYIITIAGRSLSRLQRLQAALPGGAARLRLCGGVHINDADSLQRMCQGTKLLMSAVGPYRFYGEPVVQACVQAGTDYLDLCGEPEFIERMELRYGAAARAAGCFIASAAGFDSVPADMGAVFTQRLFAPPAVPSSVEAVIAVSAPAGYSIHYATWEAAVNGFASVGELHALRREARDAQAGAHHALSKPLGPRPKAPGGPYWDPRIRAYSLPFPGADASVVRRTQLAMSAAGETPVHFTARFAVASGFWVACAVATGAAMQVLTRHAWGRRLLLRFPRLFTWGLVSHAGPTREQMEHCTTTVTLFGKGYRSAEHATSSSPPPKPDQQVTVRVTMGDLGYLATSQIFVQTALTLMEEREGIAARLPGGVYTVGAIFRDTRLVQRLSEHDVRFEVVSQ